MNKQEALYFLEGLACGLAAPEADVAKSLFTIIALEHRITRAELDVIRREIDIYLDVVEQHQEDPQHDLQRLSFARRHVSRHAGR